MVALFAGRASFFQSAGLAVFISEPEPHSPVEFLDRVW
jgi:hypothetical protein